MATHDDIYRTLEDMLCNQTGKPLRLSLHFLQSITKDFSEANLIGSGGFGDVYKVCGTFSSTQKNITKPDQIQEIFHSVYSSICPSNTEQNFDMISVPKQFNTKKFTQC